MDGRGSMIVGIRHVMFATALALVVLVAGAACGGDDKDDGGDSIEPAATQAIEEPTTEAPDDAEPTSAPSGGLDACELITKDEVEAAIGATVLDGEADQAATLFTCSFNDPETPIFSLAGVGVFVADNEDDANEVYELAMSNAAEVQELSGLGEAAYWDATLNTMQIVEGRYQVSVDVTPTDGGDQLAAATAIAEKALSRLP